MVLVQDYVGSLSPHGVDRRGGDSYSKLFTLMQLNVIAIPCK